MSTGDVTPSLFSDGPGGAPPPPLAERMRPRDAADLVGQAHLLGHGGLLSMALESGDLTSLILYGPPGTGKTTLARLLAARSRLVFEPLSAVTSGVKDVREVTARARARRAEGRGTLLFVDEIHRFNRAQQDAFLPHIESGTVVLVGATTENPGFALIGALLSRCQVVRLEPLDEGALDLLLRRALSSVEQGLAGEFTLAEDARVRLIDLAGGDARKLLGLLESASGLARRRHQASKGPWPIERDLVDEAAQHRAVAYDSSGDDRYDLLSAFHKSLRGSDPDAALYWMAAMLEAGEDPRVPARRMVAMASEDIGLADPHALPITLAALEAVQALGLPEGGLALTQAVLHLATAPKSDTVARAWGRVRKAVQDRRPGAVPLHIRNAPTDLAKEAGHGADYRYPHDYVHHYVAQRYLPVGLEAEVFFRPESIGAERQVVERWRFFKRLAVEGHAERKPPA